VALVLREVLLFPIGIAVTLSPGDFGPFAATLFVISSASAILDLSVGAALVRHQRNPADTDIQSPFTFRLPSLGMRDALVWLAAPVLATVFRTNGEAQSFVRLRRNLPNRALWYRPLATLDTKQTTVSQGVAGLVVSRGFELHRQLGAGVVRARSLRRLPGRCQRYDTIRGRFAKLLGDLLSLAA
jgi:hypothetical protein